MDFTPRFPDWSQLSPQERGLAAETCRTRAHGIGRKLHAVVDEIPAQRPALGALTGFPYAAKDMIATGVTAASWGCGTPIGDINEVSSIITDLAAAGADLVATAEMTTFAYEPSGINAARGNVINPWNADYAPGGSSSGSAALVASGCCVAALGSDTGGSVRIPAHCCGITALKPTWGGIAVDHTMPLCPSLDTIGILARSAADIAPMWAVLSQRDAATEMNDSSAVMLDEAFAASETEIAHLCRNAVEVLRALGLSITGRSGFPEDADRNSLLVMQAEAARTHATRMDDERVDAVLRRRLGKGASISDAELAASLNARDTWRGEFISSYLGDAAVALLPVMPIHTPRIADVDPASPDFKARTLYAMSRFTRFVNYLGLPALAMPVGFDKHGMPVGLQMVGRPDSEATLLKIARKYQAATDWHGRVPSGIAADIAAEKELTA